MNCVVEERINGIQSENALVQDTKKEMVKCDGRPKLNNDESKSPIIELFPWVLEFRKMCKCIHLCKSMASLTELMQFYVRNVSISVNECYTKPLKAAKLKDSISETLLLFLYVYRELSEDRSRSTYLNSMSNLLALYIDMELKASRKSTEDHDKICARLTSCLYVYLEHSTEHLLDTLMKIQFMNRNYHHILDPIITKIMKNVPMHPESTVMYVRYFLIYRLWRKINEDVAVKNQITAAAIASLGPLPSTFSPCVLRDVLPKVPKSQPNSTKVLLQHKFDIKKHCELFIQYCRETGGSVSQKKDGPVTSNDSSSRIINSQMPEDIADKDVECVDNIVNSIISDKNKQNGSMSLPKSFKPLNFEEQTSFKCLGTFSNNISTKHTISKTIKSNKNLLQRKCKKSNEIVIIDLTSDIIFEKCIKKRKSRKLPWLEEAKKRIDLKIVKASQKIKKKKKNQENIGHTHLSSISRNINHQSEDTSKFIHASENITSKNNVTTCRMIDIKSSKNRMEIDKELITCTENERKPIDVETSTKEINIKTGCTFSSTLSSNKPLLTECCPLKKFSDIIDKDNCFNNESVSKTNIDEKGEGRFNKQTVIKRLIETDTFSEPEMCGRAESLKNICDLGTECPSVNNTAIHTQYDSKDNANSNRCNVNVTNEKVSETLTSSIIVAEHETSDQHVSSDETCTTDYSHKMVKCETKCIELVETRNTTDKNETIFSEVLEAGKASSIKELEKNEEKQQSCVTLKDSVLQNKFEPQTESNLLECTNTMDDRSKNEFNMQTKLNICNYDEAKKDIREDKSSVTNVRVSIFESYSMDKKDVSNTVNLRYANGNIENNENSYADVNFNESLKDMINGNCDTNYGKYVNKKDISHECNEVSHLSTKVTSKKQCDKLHKTMEEKDVCNVVENKYIVADSELQDNIDGLSLLASVSQHIPHLKPEIEIKSDQIKVKDYASLRYGCYNHTTDDENDTNDSLNTVSQLLENPSTEIINRIVGVYPEDVLDKVALHVEVTSNDAETGNADDEMCKVGPHPETNMNYDEDMLTNNLACVESNVQTVKENTNVILNGETVVLLQKSPNSNLYIINKAVENSKDHNNDEEMSRLKEKNWTSSSEECGQLEAIASLDHASYNLELTLYNKELPYQESKRLVGRGKGIKVEPEESNFSEAKSHSKKGSLSSDVLSINSQMYQDVNGVNKPIDNRKPAKPNIAFRQNIKQEFNNIPNHIASNCAIPGCSGIHSHPHEVDAQHPLHIPVTHPTTLTSIYGNCAGNADLCVPYHKHCTPVSCSLQINATSPLHSHTKSGNPCGRAHCSCLNCTYDIVAHCRQCIHPTTDTRVSCIESSPYFMPTHSSVQTPAVQEHDKAKSEAVIGKLYDDQLLCKIEKNLLQNNSLDKLEVQYDSEKLFKMDADNKLPLKKRLKAHAMAYGEMPIKTEKVDNYPAIPMMSIAALEALDSTQQRSAQMIKSEFEFSSRKKEDPHSGHHYNSNLVRRDYYKDIVSNSHQNLTTESTRKRDRQFRSANDQSSNTVCQESCLQSTFKTPAQRKEINMPNATSLKRFGTESMGQGGTYKKAKKTQSPIRKTRSSKRNVPKVNYSYTDVDPEWNPSGEAKRKRKKTSR